MKIFDLAIKDLVRSFRSVFAVMFMFGIPLLVTAMFYVMFGSIKGDDSGFSLPQTRVVIANLDAGGIGFETALSQLPVGMETGSLGEMIVQVLQQEAFASLMEVTLVEDAGAARSLVDNLSAGVAVIIPADFSDRFVDMEGQAVLEVYQDPTLTIGPAVVRSVLNQFMDGLSGAKIAVKVAISQAGAVDPAFIGRVMEAYLAASASTRDPASLLEVRAPAASNTEDIPLVKRILGPIMGAMMIFYAFYTATATAQTLLHEDEIGVLPRLFTTPTTHATILGGKLLAVLLTVTIQVIVLLVLGALIFNLKWGNLPSVILFSVGTILVASAFGVFVNSLTKSTKQGGLIFGGVLTFSGMIGMMPVFTAANPSATIETISLIVPQGWAVHGLFQSMQGAPTASLLTTLLVMIAWALVLFVVGIWRFQKRYA